MTLPRHLIFETTNLCQSKCVTCFIHKNKPLPKDQLLSPERLQEIFRSKLFSKVEDVLNSGGEATLTDIERTVRIEHDCLPSATRFQISSNGLRPEYLFNVVTNLLQDPTMNLDIGLSLEGIGEAHDLRRGVRGNFEKVDWLINHLISLPEFKTTRLTVSFAAVLASYTLRSKKALSDYAKQHGIYFVWCEYNNNAAGYYENEEATEPPLTQEECYRAVDEVMQPSIYKTMWLNAIASGQTPRFHCKALENFLCLKCNGDISPCLCFWNDSIGNVRNADPMEVWNSENADIVRRKVKTHRPGCLNTWCVNWSIAPTHAARKWLFKVLKDFGVYGVARTTYRIVIPKK